MNACSKYLDVIYGPDLVALNKPGQGPGYRQIAAKALANFSENEDLLLVMLESSMNRKQTDRALTYANKLTAEVTSHRKPEVRSRSGSASVRRG